ncbi:MAG: cobyric acid synthase, partial [Deltaproteobacteria bacterium]|nr:cobyric acid synthase [Deltaproteobacteria bacterium]
MSHALMFQGTGSGVGKSVIAAGFCRLLKKRGFLVRPFKAQNMALNSGVTPDGLEIGRAQIVQARACGVDPDARMNPILLKPQGPGVSQLIRMGKVVKTCSAREYYTLAEENFVAAKQAMHSLREECEWLVIEGAGSPAEINLQKTDIVNMRLAEAADARVMLIGDIDRGGVFAWLKGTYDLVQPHHRTLLKGMLINKFRGDVSLLQPGIEMFAEHVPVPVLGVIPWIQVELEDEDSQNLESKLVSDPKIQVAVVRLPYLSNFTDFDPLRQVEGLSLLFTTKPSDLEQADLVILPGSKNTLHDMQFLKESGITETLQ